MYIFVPRDSTARCNGTRREPARHSSCEIQNFASQEFFTFFHKVFPEVCETAIFSSKMTNKYSRVLRRFAETTNSCKNCAKRHIKCWLVKSSSAR